MSGECLYTCCKCKTTKVLDPCLDKLVCMQCNKPACWNCQITSPHMTQLTHNWIQIPLDERAGHLCGYVCCKCGDLRKVTVADARNIGPWWSGLFSTFSHGHSEPLKLATVICNGCNHGCCRLCHRFKVSSRAHKATNEDVDWATRQALLATGKIEELKKYENPNVVERLDAWVHQMQTPPLSSTESADTRAGREEAQPRTTWEIKQEATIHRLTEAMRAAGLLAEGNTPPSTTPSPTPSLTDSASGSMESEKASLENLKPLLDIRGRDKSASRTRSLTATSSSNSTRSGPSSTSSPDLHEQHTARMEKRKGSIDIAAASQRSSLNSVASDPFPYEEWLSGE